MSDDFRDRIPEADRIRDRIREQRDDQYSSAVDKGKESPEFDGVGDDPTFERQIDSGDPDAFAEVSGLTAELKAEAPLDEFDHAPDIMSLKWQPLRGAAAHDEGDAPDGYLRYELSDLKNSDLDRDAYLKLPDIDGESADGETSATASVDERWIPETNWKMASLDGKMAGDGPDALLKSGGVEEAMKNVEGVVADDVQGFDDTSGEERSLPTSDEPVDGWKVEEGESIVAESNATPMLGPRDDITGSGEGEAMKLIDPATPLLDDADIKQELGVDAASPRLAQWAEGDVNADGSIDGSDFQEQVADKGTGEDGFLIEIDGVNAGHVIDPVSDPVGDALAPLDGGDELVVLPEVDDVADAATPLLDDEPLDGV